MSAGVTKAALREAVEEAQVREWNRLLEGTRRAIRAPNSIEVENSIEVIREHIKLVGPTPWNQVPWAIFASHLYELIIGPEHADVMPSDEERLKAADRMADHTNMNDVTRCGWLRTILRQEGTLKP